MEPEQQQRLQGRIDALVRQGELQQAVDILGLWNRQFGYQPWVWAALGRLLLQRGDREGAGRALFWAGVRGGEEQPLVDAFAARMRGRPAVLLRRVPGSCRQPLAAYPEALRADLVALGVTDRMMERARRERSDCLEWLLMLFLGAALLVGSYQILAAAWRWLASLFA